jgi:hypothetical protein
MSIDELLVNLYPKFGVPADQIVTSPQLANEFVELVNQQLPESARVDVQACNKRLLNLRKRGEAKGGLPRLTKRI